MNGNGPRTPDLVQADFFLLRTPLLSFDEIARWSDGLDAPRMHGEGSEEELAAAVAGDRAKLRKRLGILLRRPEIREALYVASPSLIEGLDAWHRDPESKKGSRVEVSLVRYLQRMSTRATPFGLFSGCTVGTVGAKSSLQLAERAKYRRHTRLDSDYLCQLCEDLGRSPELKQRQRYHVNSSLYRLGGKVRYAESRLRGRSRIHHLVSVEDDPYLSHALDAGVRGVTVEELARELVDLQPEDRITFEEALEFTEELIDGQILVPEVSPLVTGAAPIDDLITKLEALGACRPASEVLTGVRARLGRLDSQPLGSDLRAYPDVAAALASLPPEVDGSRLLQVDMMKPGTAGLDPSLLAEIERGVEILHRFQGGARWGGIEAFREAFFDRYEEGQEVPLVEVLDDELGSGFGPEGLSGDPSALLAGLTIPPKPSRPSGAGEGERLSPLLLGKLEAAIQTGAFEIEVTSEDVESLPRPETPLPDAFVAKVALAAASEADLAEGRFQIVLDFATGPSGAQMLGRFCYADSSLDEGVRRHLRREESVDPEAIFAEVVHLPEGRLGNIIHRPALRDYEIPFLGRSGLDERHQIPVTDLLVSISGGRIVLRSRRLGRRVVPRLTSAHNFTRKSLRIYRFLCMLQFEGVSTGVTWTWGPLRALTFLPRVRCGRVVLSRARWRASQNEIEALHQDGAAERFAAVQRWRAVRRLPRKVFLADGENHVLVDFDNSLSVDSFLDTVRNRTALELVEMLPEPEKLCSVGPEGRFVHELLIPMTLRGRAAARPTSSPISGPVKRCFPPGSEWLFVKLYTGTATADRVLTDVMWPLIHDALAAGIIDRWFFIRFADPHPHLRLRFHGSPETLHRDLLPALEARAAPLLDNGQAWRLQIQEYRREVERYGGAAGIGLAEQWFHIDSEAVVHVLRALPGSDGPDERWRLALLGTDLLIADLRIESADRLDFLSRMKRRWAAQFQLEDSRRFKKELSNRLRQEMESLRALLFQGSLSPDDPLSPAVAALRRRSERLRPIAGELRGRERSGALSSSVRSIAYSLIHMYNNRLFRSEGREHEMVLSDFLDRIYRSEAARRSARDETMRKAG